MVIDDEYDIIYILRRQLELWGYEVDTFTNPLHAIEVFKANPDRYAVVLTDIRMPEISGINLAQIVLRANPKARIIIMTAFEMHANDLKASLPKIKTEQVLIKPLNAATTCAAIKTQLRKVRTARTKIS
jgi:DNA-binding NtrC family response regulator